MATPVGVAWLAAWIIIAVLGSVRLLVLRTMRHRHPPGPERHALEINRRRVAIGTAIFALLAGGAISTPSIQHLVTKPTLLDVVIVVVVLPPLLISARQLLFTL